VPARIYVVADPPEAERIAGWLAEDIDAEIRAGAASDETLTEVLAEPPQVLVLTAGLRGGDALSFAGALRAPDADISLVLIADHDGPVRNALDAMPFRADRFLRRPLSRSALVFAVRSCLNLGRPGVVGAVSPARPSAPVVSSAISVLRELEAPTHALATAQISSGVALFTLDARLEQATSEAIDAFLEDAVDAVLSDAPVLDEPDAPPVVTPSPAATEPAPAPREPTVVLAAAPQAPEELRTGTFVSALRRHMSAVEARLFGEPAAEPPAPDDETGEIDLDAIGVTTLSAIADEEAVAVTESEAPPAIAAGSGTGADVIDLSVEDFAALLGRLSREGVTGRLELRRGDARKTVWLEEGRPVFASSESPGDRMGDLLVREGKIGRDQLARAREARDASGRRIGEILVEQGALKRRELYPAVRRHLEDLIYSLFAWESGSCALAPGTGARDEKIRLAAPAAALVSEGIRRKLSLTRLRALVGPAHTVLAPRLDLGEALADVDLAAEERALLPLFDGQRALAEIALEGGAAEVAVYQLAHLLRALDLVAPSEGSQPAAVEVTRVTTGVAGPSSVTADAGIDRERVLSKYAQVLEGDYFEILGVRRDASGYEVRRAFESARRDFARESFPAELQRDLDAELGAIAEVLAEAQRVLRDDGMRAAYRDALPAGDL
jgi:DNA-binding NarL/FixJ family response regulator